MIRTWLTNARGRFIWRLRFAGYTVATHQKTQQGLKPHLIYGLRCVINSRNASEKPAGIETYEKTSVSVAEEPVATHQKTQQGLKPSTGVWTMKANTVATHQKTQQGLKLIYNTQEVQQ